MKKPKINIDKDAIREFFVEHVEKIVFGVVVIGFVLIVLQALYQKPYDKAPKQLQERAQAAQNHIRNCRATDPNIAVEDYVAAVQRIVDAPIQAEAYRHETYWSPPNESSQLPRGIPQLFAVNELRAVPGRSPITVKRIENIPGPPGRPQRTRTVSARQGIYWVVVTGMVPTGQQLAEYAAHFTDRQEYDSSRDVPVYANYYIERAEAADATPADQLAWSRLDVAWTRNKINEVIRARVGAGRNAGDSVDEQFRDDNLTMPPIPLAGQKTWDADAIGHPALTAPAKGEEPLGEDTPDNGAIDIGAPPPFGAHPAVPAGASSEHGEEPTPPGTPSSEETQARKLLRFFDFTVQPGKQYRYRVRLLLENPNKGMDAKYLEANVDETYLVPSQPGVPEPMELCPFLATDWSVPASAVTVPPDTQLCALSVSQPTRRAGAEPSGRMAVIKWVAAHGVEASHEFNTHRGMMADFPAVPHEFTPDAARPGTRATAAPQTIDVDFTSKAIVLDMRGGDILPGRANQSSPGEILLSDADGNLLVFDEIEGRAAYDLFRGIEPAVNPPSGTGPAVVIPGLTPGRPTSPHEGEGATPDLDGGLDILKGG